MAALLRYIYNSIQHKREKSSQTSESQIHGLMLHTIKNHSSFILGIDVPCMRGLSIVILFTVGFKS